MASADIKYLNKDFTTFKQALIEYAKAYYPTAYNDFSVSSPGTMFIDMASYVGDVLSFYLDNQVQESFLEFAKQQNNLYALAYMLGYRPKVTSAAVTSLDVYQQVRATIVNGIYQPDFNDAVVIEEGMQVQSTVSAATFYVPQKIDFSVSSSIDPTSISVYKLDGNGRPDRYLLKKTVPAISGEVVTKTFTFGVATRFATVEIVDTNIIQILNVVDSTSGDRWYEVPYLAQNYILESVANTAANYPDLAQYSDQVPFVLKKLNIPKRFVSRQKSIGVLELEFGAGINNISSSLLVPNMNGVGYKNILNFAPYNQNIGRSYLTTAFDPTNFVTTEDYGLAPSNTTLTVTYLVGGGAGANVQTNEITTIKELTANFKGTPAGPDIVKSTIAVNNPVPATGGGDGDTVEELRLNTLAQYPSQMRAVTQQDYLGTILGMSPEFGQVAKAYITKDELVFRQYLRNEPGERDPLATTAYITAFNSAGQFTDPTPALYRNIQTYLSEYRMLTDVIYLKPAYIINIGVSFDIVLRPNYTSREVLNNALVELKSYFDRTKWEINQPIILSEVYTLIDRIQGVQTVQKVSVNNLSGEDAGYSKYSYDISAATLNNIIYPSLDPSIFEVKYPDIDIQGRVVTTM